LDLAPFMADSSGDTERSGQIRAGRSESRSRPGEAGTNRGRVASGGPRGWAGTGGERGATDAAGRGRAGAGDKKEVVAQGHICDSARAARARTRLSI